jgi:hypothetical protein
MLAGEFAVEPKGPTPKTGDAVDADIVDDRRLLE